MITDRMIEELTETAQRVAGKKNRILKTEAMGGGYAIRLHKVHEDDCTGDVFYSGNKDKPYGYLPSTAAIYDTVQQAWNELLADKVQLYRDKEIPSVVFVQTFSFISETEVKA